MCFLFFRNKPRLLKYIIQGCESGNKSVEIRTGFGYVSPRLVTRSWKKKMRQVSGWRESSVIKETSWKLYKKTHDKSITEGQRLLWLSWRRIFKQFVDRAAKWIRPDFGPIIEHMIVLLYHHMKISNEKLGSKKSWEQNPQTFTPISLLLSFQS